jgi:acetyl esterase/lipase
MPWIFVCLMIANAAYFGWKFMEGTQPLSRPLAVEAPLGGAEVRLLSERPELGAPPAVDAASVEEEMQVLAPAPASGSQCFSLGPFVTDAALQKMVLSMQGKGFSTRVDRRRVEARDYWVFVPAFTNREKAEERLRELRARGIEGFVVKDGAFVNAISLNHFSQKELAQAFLQKMQAAGVSVEFREISQNGMERWLYLSQGRSRTGLREAVDAVTTKQDGLKRENAPCEE